VPESVGDHAIGVAFAGDGAHEPSTGSGVLTVGKADVNLAAADASGTILETVTLSAVLTRSTDSAALSGRAIGFSIDGTSVGNGTTNGAGSATLSWAITPGPTSRTIGASFAGDEWYTARDASATLTASKVAAKMYMPDRSGIGAEPVLLRGYLYRKSDSAGLSGKTLAFEVAGTSVGSAVTDANGSASMVWIIDAGAATRQIAARFSGDDTYGASSSTATLVVSTYDTKLLVPDRSGELNDAIYLRGYLYRVAGSLPVQGRQLDFRVDGTSVGSATTNTLGRAQLVWVPPDTLMPGTHDYRAVWTGDAGYRASSGSGALSVSKGVSYLWLYSRSLARGSTAYLRAYLRRLPDYAWLPGRSVQFTLDGVALGSGTTDANGMAAYQFTAPPGMATGAHPMEAEFAGDTWYLENGASGTLTVTP
jgi:hypothetical protein